MNYARKNSTNYEGENSTNYEGVSKIIKQNDIMFL